MIRLFMQTKDKPAEDLHLYKSRDPDYSRWILAAYKKHGKPLAKPSISSHHAEWAEAIGRCRK